MDTGGEAITGGASIRSQVALPPNLVNQFMPLPPSVSIRVHPWFHLGLKQI